MEKYYIKNNPFNTVVYEDTEPSFGESFRAAFGYQYSPIISRTQEELYFGDVEREADFDPFDNYEGYEGFEDDIVRAKNMEHLSFIKNSIDENRNRRAVLAESDFFSGALVAGIVDPLNIAFALPVFGQLGLIARGGMTVGQAARASAKGGLAIGAVSEGVRAPFDEINTTGETAMNLLTTTAFSTLLGAAPSAVFNTRGSFQRSAAKLRDLTKGEMGDEIDGTAIVRNEKSDDMVATKKGKIVVNPTKIEREFDERPWTAEGINDFAFNSPREYEDFLVNKENIKKTDKRVPGETSETYNARINEQALERTYEGYGLKETAASNSIFYRLLTTPGKRILLNDKVPDWIKRSYTLMEGNASMAQERNLAGKGVQSIRQRIPVHTVRGRKLVQDLRESFNLEVKQRRSTQQLAGLDIDDPKRILGYKGNFGTWMDQTIDDYLKYNDPNLRSTIELTDTKKQSFEAIRLYFDDFLEAGQDVGLFRNVKNLDNHTKNLKQQIDDLEQEVDGMISDFVLDAARAKSDKKYATSYNKIVKERDTALEKITSLREDLDYYEGYKKYYGKTEYNFPIYYDKELLSSDPNARKGLEDVFERYIAKETHYYDGKKWVKKPLDFDSRERAEQIVSNILEEDIDMSPSISRGPSNKHLKHRALDIPEYAVREYIVKDERVIHSYSQRMGRQIEWQRNFGDQSIDDILENIEKDLLARGFSQDEMIKIRTDFLSDYERVMGRHIRNPDSLTNQIARGIKETAGLTYLHSAGISSITDAGMLVMERGFRNVLRPLIDKDANSLFSKAKRDVNKIVEGTDLLIPGVQQRIIGDSIQGINPNTVERIFNPITSAFYNIPILGNNLGSVTRYGKIVDATYRQSEIIEMSVNVSKNKANAAKDLEYLARYGIDEDDAKNIANLNNVWETNENGSFYYANIDNWPKATRADRELIMKYKTALNSGTGNTIMHATSFDKPMLADGVLYVRHYPWMEALTFGKLKPDPRASTKNIPMARLESGAMAFPFQFMSFTMAATNRITAQMFDPSRQYRLNGAIALAGLSYLSLQIKKPDWWFESKGVGELTARVLDHSGIMGVYSDIAYMALHGAIGMGAVGEGSNRMEWLKGKYKPTEGDALFEPLGAGPGIVREWYLATQELLDGYTEDGKKRLYYNFPSLPLLGLTGFNEDVKELWLR